MSRRKKFEQQVKLVAVLAACFQILCFCSIHAAEDVNVEIVCYVQEFLNAHGFDCGPVDGDFGSRSSAALSAYQASIGVQPDGIISNAHFNKHGADLLIYSFDGVSARMIGSIPVDIVHNYKVTVFHNGFIYTEGYKGYNELIYYEWDGVSFIENEYYSGYGDSGALSQYFDISDIYESMPMVDCDDDSNFVYATGQSAWQEGTSDIESGSQIFSDDIDTQEGPEYFHFENNLIEKNFPFTGSFSDASDWLQANGYEFRYGTNDEMRPCISFENPDKSAWHLEVLQLDPEKEYGLIVKAKDWVLQDPIDWTRAEDILTDEIADCFGGEELVNGFLESNGYSVYIGNGFYQISSASASDAYSQDIWQATMPVSGDSEEEWQAAKPVTDVQEQTEQKDDITVNMDYEGMSFCLRSNVYSGKWVNDDGQLIIDGGKLEAHFGKTAENNYEYHFYGSYQGSYDLGTDGFRAYTIPEGGGINNSFNIILLNGVLRITAQHPEDENVLGKGKVCQYYPAESAGEKTFWERSETATMDPLGTKVSESSERLSTPVIMEIIRHHIQYIYMDSGYNDWDVYMYGRKTEDYADKAFFIIHGYREDGLEEAFNYTVTFIQNNGWWLDEIEVLEANDTPFYS